MKHIKKSIALLLSLSLLLGVGSLTAFAEPSICAVVVYEEDFESEPTGWTFVDVDGIITLMPIALPRSSRVPATGFSFRNPIIGIRVCR